VASIVADALPSAVRTQWDVFHNEEPAPVSGGPVEFPEPGALQRVYTARVRPPEGRTAGAIPSGPATYDQGPGPIEPADWSEWGVDAWPGGAAEMKVSGKSAGACIMTPYRVAVGRYLRSCSNRIGILLLNTLGPYLKGFSATHFVFPGQEKSGLSGAVRLLASES
jgi:hypothetical protein